MYDNILVPVSFEPDRNAQEAIDIAQGLAEGGADITLLHVMEQIPPYAAAYLPRDHFDQAHQRIAEALATLAEGVPGARVEVISGHAGRSIVDWATEHRVDCIVIASHRPGMADLLIGSTAAQVVRHAPCAVHVLR
ncbi:universal stress protein [Rhodovulum sp. 12E13]|uniref:universal stress protein n=1 Tax=Rhodovulum sp. 12E13 TaxID=2203891 RepID=UPI000E16F3B2|nr:universal stress protein [Rhodovulum sp. 12E13]RDC71353.1 universal stress protein [Rhodovulum sp. 12E13]